ncbi:hypothetical protein BCR33DRAFT_75727 [Rhizoclosmatium globosum]|uniref:Uncharacterized protein n=1 Tax=Rhizoclosmatium globosum TaxID=329046 RepID=A0A1Y2CKT0_9FUNG|nr:hypothetical protein BCR33DRAFT_75727 [Rhizoclosmatium globosum]|eukprot:ORY47628.1 hypothetical protein BCR33DRAFT_75727 [Rhizoclosmatium globosum]
MLCYNQICAIAVWRNDLKRCYLKSSVWGTPVLNPNANIQFAPFEDLVLGIGTDNLLRWRDPEIPIWKSVGTGMRLLDILQLSDLSFVGVGLDNNLYWASSLHSQWYLVPGSGSVTRIAIMRSNFAWIFGVGMDCELYYVNILQGFNAQGLRGGFKWYHVPNSGCIIDVLQLPNGYVGGIGRDNKLYYMQNFYSLGWQLAPNFNGAITGLAELSDSTLLGIGMDGSVWRMNSWDTGFPDGNGLTKSCCISAITSAI